MEDGFLTFGVRAGTTDERELDKIDSVLSYSSSLRTAVRLVLKEPAFFGEPKTFSFKFIRVAKFLKDNAPSRVSDSRDGYRREEQHGPLALGPVGLGILLPVFRHLKYFVAAAWTETRGMSCPPKMGISTGSKDNSISVILIDGQGYSSQVVLRSRPAIPWRNLEGADTHGADNWSNGLPNS